MQLTNALKRKFKDSSCGCHFDGAHVHVIGIFNKIIAELVVLKSIS